jgi:hypothetical protein
LFRILFSTIVLLLFTSASASCSGPTGNEADLMYNKDYHTMQFCNGTNWVSMGGGGGSGPMSLISTQTASASASLQFTNLPTSYNTLFLNCSGLVPSAGGSNQPALQVGEGAGPTWKTSTYEYTGYASGSSIYSNPFYNASASSILLTASSIGTSSAGGSLKIYIDNTASSSIYKNVTAQGTSVDVNGDLFTNIASGTFMGDTNPITALKIFLGAGNITSGTCSLYGMN